MIRPLLVDRAAAVGFRWAPGVLSTTGDRVCAVSIDTPPWPRFCGDEDYTDPKYAGAPDLSDDATLGVLEAQVREKHGGAAADESDPDAEVRIVDVRYQWSWGRPIWCVRVHLRVRQRGGVLRCSDFQGESRVAALVAALEAPRGARYWEPRYCGVPAACSARSVQP